MSSVPVSLSEEVRRLRADLRAALSADGDDATLEAAAGSCRIERAAVDERLTKLSASIARAGSIPRQLDDYAVRLRKELEVRLTDIDLTLHRMEGCAEAFFDEILRTRRAIDMLDQSSVREEYNNFVAADTEREIDNGVEEIADWLASSELSLWKALDAQMDLDGSDLAKVISVQLEARFDYDRSRLLTSLGAAAREAMEIFNPADEGAQVAESARNAATNALFVALAAVVALGAAISSPNTMIGPLPPFSFAAGLAAAAIAVIPYSRRRAKKRLRARVHALRAQLQRIIRRRAANEIEASKAKILDVVKEPLEETRSQEAGLVARRDELSSLEERVSAMQLKLSAEPLREDEP